MKKDREAEQKNSRRGYWGGMLFGLLFFSVGAGFLLFGVVPNLWDAYRMQAWEAVPAEVVHLKLKTNRTDDGSTYKVTARFRYTYNGREYNSDRVGIASGASDSVGNWQRDTHTKLRRKRQTKVWVNPENPDEAVYDRELRWGLLGFKMIFVIVFGGFGGGLMWLLTRKKKPLPRGLPAWQDRPEWLDNKIRSSAKTTVWLAWVFAIFWNAISSPIPFMLPGELAKGNHLALVGLLFPLVGLGLLVWALRQTLNWRRFGPTLLQMDPFPGAIGGDVDATLELRLPYNPKHDFEVTLTCQHVYTQKSGDGSRTVRDVQWQDRQRAEVQPGMRGTRLQFLFNPPDDLPESSGESGKRYEWTVEITASLPGSDFNRSWEIPVIREAGTQASRIQPRRRPREAEPVALADAALQIGETGTGIELYYPYLRQPGMALGTLLTGCAFIGFAWLFNVAGDGDAMTRLFIGLFMVVGTLIAVLGLYMAGNSMRVTAGSNRLRIERGIFGLHRTRELAARDIRTIEKKIGMQSSSGSQMRAYYRIEVHTRDGRDITAGSGLLGASHVDAIISRLRAALDISEQADEREQKDTRHTEAEDILSAEVIAVRQLRMKRIRTIGNFAAGAIFLAIVLWNFRGVLFRLL